jgi:hypothetical protein
MDCSQIRGWVGRQSRSIPQDVDLFKFMSKELKTLVESLVLEGVMDYETTQISRMVVGWLKTELFAGSAKLIKPKTWRYQLILKWLNKPLSIVVQVTPSPKLERIQMQHGEYQVARYKTEPKPGSKKPVLPPDQLSLNIGVPSDSTKLNPTQLEPFVFDLKSVIRHELEHSRQKTRGFQTASGAKTDPWSQDLDTSKVFSDQAAALQYYTSPDEVEAYVMQVYRTAKMKKIPFEQALKEYITGVMGQRILKGMGVAQGINTLNKIKRAWLNYAQKRLPGLFKTQ